METMEKNENELCELTWSIFCHYSQKFPEITLKYIDKLMDRIINVKIQVTFQVEYV
jgi:hypothetical protein